MEHDDLYVECKCTSKESIRIEAHWLAMAAERALMGDQEPVLAVRLEALGGANRDWALVRLDMLAGLFALRERE